MTYGASRKDHLMVKETAGKATPASVTRTTEKTLLFRKSDVLLKPTLFGISLSMKDFETRGEPGEPALPRKIIRVALPKGHSARKLSQKTGSTVLLNHTPEPLSCIQEPSLGTNPELPYSRIKRTLVRPDREKYQAAFTMGKKVCRLAGQEMMGLIPCALVEIWPVRFTREGLLELVEEVTLKIVSEPSKEIARQEKETLLRLSPKTIVRRHVIANDLVINNALVQKELKRNIATLQRSLEKETGLKKKTFKANSIKPPSECDYLILTDNNKWDPATMQPTSLIGDMVGEFVRLANWKKSRGLRTYVATVKNIVDGKYGDFKTGARDLQEVIRNFLQWFCRSRGVEYLLLGGDVSMIPARQVAGAAWGQIGFGSLDKKNVIEWKGTYMGMHIDTGDFGQSTHILTNYDTGRIIPFDSAGTSNTTTAGWYHTTDSTFTTRTAANTEWVRINGPSAQINAKMVWYTNMNLIPTDLYYASLYGSGYSVAGKHDWDQLDNGLYGQHNATNNFDMVNYQADVSVGRAPVESIAEAQTFIDKILEYEKWGSTPRPDSDYDRFRRMLFAAATWGKYIRIERDPAGSDPPANNKYTSSGEHALLHCDTLPPDAGSQLTCYFSDQYYRLLNYNSGAKHNHPGWYYAKSGNDLSPSVTVWDFFFFSWEFPKPTAWIAVWDGNPDVLNPMYYALDFPDLDSSITEQEALREKMQTTFPEISQIERLYTDEADMNPAEVAETWLRHLTSENLTDALNRGPHFVSMTGHGNSDWCAYLCTALVNGLINGPNTFILYADSCMTGMFDVNDCVAEASLKHPGGAAVAYVGNSRFSWIGTGALYRELFFTRLQTVRHIGEMNDSRFELLAGTTGWTRESRIWYCFVPHLFGDPEMPVYRNIAEAKNYYIGNWNTYELHDCRCQWVERMSLKHKVYFEKLQMGLNAGYDGCGFCLKKHHTC